MFGNIKQNKKDQKEGLEKKEDVVLDFFGSDFGKQIAQQMDSNQAFIDERFMPQNGLFSNHNKLLDMFLSFQACNRLSKLDLSTLNKLWPGLNSGQSVKLLTSDESRENINDNNIGEKNSILDAINKIKNKIESEDGDNKNQTNFYDDKNLLEK